MKVKDIVNRLKDTRGYLNEKLDEVLSDGCDDEGDYKAELDYLLEGIEEAINFLSAEWIKDA
jgi:hypothetical protein